MRQKGPGLWPAYALVAAVWIESAMPHISGGKLTRAHLGAAAVAVLCWRPIVARIVRNWEIALFLLFAVVYGAVEEFFFISNTDSARLARRVALLLLNVGAYCALVNALEGGRPRIRRFVLFVCVSMTLFGFYQVLARYFSLPLNALPGARFRAIGPLTQATSFLAEPRFYGIFLSVLLFVVLRTPYIRRWYIIALLLAAAVMTASITAYGMVAAVIALHLLSRLRGRKGRQFPLFTPPRVVVSVVTVAVVLVVGISFDLPGNVIDRIEAASSQISFQEQLSFALKTRPSHMVATREVIELTPQRSVYLSVFGELGFIAHVLRTRPAFGYGLGASIQETQRTMGLNAFAETMVRWGLVGTIAFAVFVWRQALRFGGRRGIAFWCFVGIFLVAYGALPNLMFWVLLGITLSSSRWSAGNAAADVGGLNRARVCRLGGFV